MHLEILRQQEKLQHLFEQAKQLQQIDDIDVETKLGFAAYLCVRTSGYVEFAVKMILREYVKSKTGRTSHIANFVDKQLERTLSPRRDQILDLVGQFNSEWKENLRGSIDSELGDSLKSIVINRNNVAHGSDVNLSLRDLGKWFEDAQKIVDLVYSECS